MLEGVAITGGEPTLGGGLAELLMTIKTLGYPVKLDTNGSRPDVLEQLFERRLVDFVAMDIKAPLDAYHPFSRHPDIGTRLSESIRLIMTAATAYEFRTTCVSPFIDAEAVKVIAETIQGATRYVLQPFNQRAACLDPAFNEGVDPSISPDGMQHLKAVAEPFVQTCLIR